MHYLVLFQMQHRVRAIGPVDADVIAVVSVQRFRKHGRASGELRLKSSDGDIEFLQTESMQIELIESDITLVNTRLIRRDTVKYKVRMAYINQAVSRRPHA